MVKFLFQFIENENSLLDDVSSHIKISVNPTMLLISRKRCLFFELKEPQKKVAVKVAQLNEWVFRR